MYITLKWFDKEDLKGVPISYTQREILDALSTFEVLRDVGIEILNGVSDNLSLRLHRFNNFIFKVVKKERSLEGQLSRRDLERYFAGTAPLSICKKVDGIFVTVRSEKEIPVAGGVQEGLNYGPIYLDFERAEGLREIEKAFEAVLKRLAEAEKAKIDGFLRKYLS